MKKCYLCQIDKSGGEFYKDLRSKDGLSSKCKSCAKTFKSKHFRTKTEKYCPQCKTTMPVAAFDLNNHGDGYQTACKTCRSLVKIISKYPALTEEFYRSMMDEQRGLCKICGAFEALRVDHCHATGRVRGLLCNSCNLGLGMFKDSTERLLAAAKYLG